MFGNLWGVVGFKKFATLLFYALLIRFFDLLLSFGVAGVFAGVEFVVSV